jgi:hypothetical protein
MSIQSYSFFSLRKNIYKKKKRRRRRKAACILFPAWIPWRAATSKPPEKLPFAPAPIITEVIYIEEFRLIHIYLLYIYIYMRLQSPVITIAFTSSLRKASSKLYFKLPTTERRRTIRKIILIIKDKVQTNNKQEFHLNFKNINTPKFR